MWDKVTLFWTYCEVFSTEFRVPLKLRTYISEIGKLNRFCYFRVHYNRAESNCIFHQSHFYSVCSCENV